MTAHAERLHGSRPRRPLAVGLARRRARARISRPVRLRGPARGSAGRLLRDLRDRHGVADRSLAAITGAAALVLPAPALEVGAAGVAGAAVTVFAVLRVEEATARPGGLELPAAVVWRGLVYGVVDGLLLAVFPILVVYAALEPHKRRLFGKARRRPRGAARVRGDDRGLPPRVRRVPRRRRHEAGRRQRRVVATDPRDREPDRVADRARRDARDRGRAQLRDRHVPAPARDRHARAGAPSAPRRADRADRSDRSGAAVSTSDWTWTGAAGYADVRPAGRCRPTTTSGSPA